MGLFMACRNRKVNSSVLFFSTFKKSLQFFGIAVDAVTRHLVGTF